TFDEAVAAAAEAGKAIAAAEGEAAAADYLSEAVTTCLDNLERLEALQGTGLLDTPPRPDLDRLTSEAAQRLGAAFALMTLVDDHRQFFASHYGLPPDLRETPRERSWCRFVAAFDEPLRINDSLNHVLVRDTPGAQEAGIRSYLGVPLRTKDGHSLGSFCVADNYPRQWQPDDQHVLEELAAQAMMLAEQAAGSEPD
ncbi:MAG: GAF domain-containing protein, partial [Acidimicrobiia bacterium]